MTVVLVVVIMVMWWCRTSGLNNSAANLWSHAEVLTLSAPRQSLIGACLLALGLWGFRLVVYGRRGARVRGMGMEMKLPCQPGV